MLLRLFINDYIHRYSRIITESVKEDTKMSFVHNLRLAGVISTQEECEEVRVLADSFIASHQRLQEQYGVEFLRKELEGVPRHFD
jgi:hypothetical protein